MSLPPWDRPADAAVAVIRDPAGRLLFIRRPTRDGDRWSGDVAFPGGLARPGETAAETAAREAEEEVGLHLGAPRGVLRDRLTAHPRRARSMRVRPVLFALPDHPDATRDTELRLDPREVAEAFWVPLARLARLPVVPVLRRIGRVRLPVPGLDLDGPHPDRRILWGLTLSMVLELRAR